MQGRWSSVGPAEGAVTAGYPMGHLEGRQRGARPRLSTGSPLSLSGFRPPSPPLRPRWPQFQERRERRGASGRGLVASAQDGGLSSAGSALEERPPAWRAGFVREVGDAALPGLGPGERDEGGPRVQGPVPGVPGGPSPPGTQHLRLLNGTPPGLPGASLPAGMGNACSPGLHAGGSSTSSGLHLLWIPRGCWGK